MDNGNGNGDEQPSRVDLRFFDLATLAPQPTKRVRVNGKEFPMFSLLDLPLTEYVAIEGNNLKTLPAQQALDIGIETLMRLCVGSVREDFRGLTMRQYFELMNFAALDIDPRNNERNPQTATTAPNPSN